MTVKDLKLVDFCSELGKELLDGAEVKSCTGCGNSYVLVSEDTCPDCGKALQFEGYAAVVEDANEAVECPECGYSDSTNCFEAVDGKAECPECGAHFKQITNESLNEAFKFVIRGGSKVRVLVRKKKRHHLTSGQKLALMKARAKAHTGAAKLKRAKSMRKRKQAGLKDDVNSPANELPVNEGVELAIVKDGNIFTATNGDKTYRFGTMIETVARLNVLQADFNGSKAYRQTLGEASDVITCKVPKEKVARLNDWEI